MITENNFIKIGMTELEKQLNTRDGAEDFRDFLEKTSEDGLRVFELWLTLNGYKKEVEKFTRLHDFTDAFAKWNMRCTKALMEKYFKVNQAHLLVTDFRVCRQIVCHRNSNSARKSFSLDG